MNDDRPKQPSKIDNMGVFKPMPPDKRLADGPMPHPSLRGDSSMAVELQALGMLPATPPQPLKGPDKEFLEGAAAFCAGLEMNKNPYRAHEHRDRKIPGKADPVNACDIWAAGWSQAQTSDRALRAIPPGDSQLIPTPFELGGKAFFDGVQLKNNPFSSRPTERREWIRGWNSGKKYKDDGEVE